MIVNVKGYGHVRGTAMQMNTLCDISLDVWATPAQWRRINKRMRKYNA